MKRPVASSWISAPFLLKSNRSIERAFGITEARQFVPALEEPILPTHELVAHEHRDEIDRRDLLDLGVAQARFEDGRLRSYLRPSLLAIDEVGYLSYDAHAADLLFQVVSRRYEQKSLVITTNLPFKQWDTVFPNATSAVALIDRLTHHAEIVIDVDPDFRGFT